MGIEYGPTTLGIPVWNFCATETGLPTWGDRLLYELPLEVSCEDLVRRKSFLPDDSKLSGVINEELSDSMAFCYLGIKSSGGSILGGS